MAGRVAELDKKPSHAQDLATDGLISAHDLREKATAMRAERECAVRKLENLKDDRENIEALKKRSKNALVACAFALHSGLRYFSAEDYQGIYKRLGLKVLVAPDGALGVEGALGADALPIDARHASRVARLVSEDVEEQDIQGIVIAAPPPGPARMRAHVGDTAWVPTGCRMETTTTKPLRSRCLKVVTTPLTASSAPSTPSPRSASTVASRS